MFTLLSRRNFGQITVNDICEEALVSRAAFYSHFNDKYDLLKYWMDSIRNDIIINVRDYKNIELSVNRFIYENSKIITNVLAHANSEVLDLLHNFMYSIIDLAVIKKSGEGPSENQILLSNFCAGGMVNLLMWQVKNNFPQDSKMVNSYFYEILECITQWDANRE